ncbi:hypothetical protein ACFJGV_07475 [Cnuibacter sp. UC19_7]|uniref:hypothetical protein n=1 Tax=Cnuibacter sp. UC19_7 TaxID=3350166 RepID=UPI003671D302
MSSERPPASGLETRQAVQVRRAPRYYRFIILGLLLGGLVTLGVTWMFPEQPDFPRWQVAGLLALFVVPVGAAVGALVALLIDAASRRRARVVEVEHIDGHEEVAAAQAHAAAAPAVTQEDAPAVAADATPSSESGEARG